MLPHILLAFTLVSTLSAMPMEETDEDMIERSHRQTRSSQLWLSPSSPNNLEKAEAVPLAGSLLHKLGKKIKADDMMESRKADDILEQNDVDDTQERSVSGRRHRVIRAFLRKLKKGKTMTNARGKKQTEYFGSGGYQEAQKKFRWLKGFGHFRRNRVFLKKYLDRVTLTIIRRNSVIVVYY